MAMADYLTDDNIEDLLCRPKTIPLPERRKLNSENWREKNGYWRAEVSVETDSNEKFDIFIRQALDDHTDFSVGLKVTFKDGSKVNLIRCNGLHGRHRNDLENSFFEDQCHVHVATERYIKNGSAAEKYAETTDMYENLNGALKYILDRCNIIYMENGLFS